MDTSIYAGYADVQRTKIVELLESLTPGDLASYRTINEYVGQGFDIQGFQSHRAILNQARLQVETTGTNIFSTVYATGVKALKRPEILSEASRRVRLLNRAEDRTIGFFGRARNSKITSKNGKSRLGRAVKVIFGSWKNTLALKV